MTQHDDSDHDGSAETVETRPLRRARHVRSLEDATRSKPGGKLAEVNADGRAAQRDSISMRSPNSAVQIAMSHLPVYKALWRLSAQKRADGVDAGVSIKELAEAAELPLSKVQNIIKTLRLNEIVRSVVTHIGWAKVQGLYYPTEAGTLLYALASYLGPDVQVQTGRTASAWAGRHYAEPESFFRHADLMRGKTT